VGKFVGKNSGALQQILCLRIEHRPFDHRSLWQPNPAQQVGVARVGADVIERRSNPKVDQQAGTLLISRVGERKRVVLFPQNAVALW
jgi:hypothetical protein